MKCIKITKVMNGQKMSKIIRVSDDRARVLVNDTTINAHYVPKKTYKAYKETVITEVQNEN
ncbi:MAG: hypothetical protein ACYDBX_02340 [Patescibacteria group bacterium]